MNVHHDCWISSDIKQLRIVSRSLFISRRKKTLVLLENVRWIKLWFKDTKQNSCGPDGPAAILFCGPDGQIAGLGPAGPLCFQGCLWRGCLVIRLSFRLPGNVTLDDQEDQLRILRDQLKMNSSLMASYTKIMSTAFMAQTPTSTPNASSAPHSQSHGLSSLMYWFSSHIVCMYVLL